MVQETAVFLRFDPPFPLFDTEAPGWNKGTGPSYGGYKRPDQGITQPVDGWMYSKQPPGFDQGRDPSGIFQKKRAVHGNDHRVYYQERLMNN